MEIVKHNERLCTQHGNGCNAARLPALVLSAFSASFLDRQKCRRWLLEVYHSTPRCPQCGHELPTNRHERFWAGEKLQCPACARWISARQGTILHGSKLSPEQIIMLALGTALGLRSDSIARLTGLSREAVRQWRIRFAEAQP